MIKREQYLSKLHEMKGEPLIKVISGVRRSGKSTLLEMFRDELLAEGVAKEQITFINFEDPEQVANADYLSIYRRIKKHLAPNQQNYVFLDEIQNVEEFEKLADGLFIQKNIDLYITGSNAYFLSSELATLLTGRYIEMKILPLSFAEYVSAFADQSRSDLLFNGFVKNGAFPLAAQLQQEKPLLVREYLQGIYNTVLFKDVISRSGVSDREVLEHIAHFLMDNIGNFTSPKKIADYMGTNYRKVAPQTVDAYLTALTDSFIVYRAGRYDVRGKQFLQTQQKYYLVDTGLRTALLGDKGEVDRGRLLENVVYLELLRRGNDVWVGKSDTGEIDFVSKNHHSGEFAYYQVADTVMDKSVLERELKPLQNTPDHNPRFLLTKDFGEYNFDGIKQLNVIDWLLLKNL